MSKPTDVALRKRASLQLPLDLVTAMLALPDDVFVEAVIQTPDDQFAGTCQVLLAGGGLPDACLSPGRPRSVTLEWEERDGGMEGWIEVLPENRARPSRP